VTRRSYYLDWDHISSSDYGLLQNCFVVSVQKKIINCTIRLWSYLQALGGKFEHIYPSIGRHFDPALHEPYDTEGLEYLGPRKDLKIVWVLCRGFQFKEFGVEGPILAKEKARVIVQL